MSKTDKIVLCASCYEELEESKAYYRAIKFPLGKEPYQGYFCNAACADRFSELGRNLGERQVKDGLKVDKYGLPEHDDRFSSE